MQVLTQEQGLKYIQDRIDTREWWIIPVATAEANEFVSDIVQRFFQGDNKLLVDFLLLSTASPSAPQVLITLASKSCCAPKDLAAMVNTPEVEGRDLLVHGTTPIAVITWLNDTFNF
jgi:hypothetical protein